MNTLKRGMPGMLLQMYLHALLNMIPLFFGCSVDSLQQKITPTVLGPFSCCNDTSYMAIITIAWYFPYNNNFFWKFTFGDDFGHLSNGLKNH